MPAKRKPKKAVQGRPHKLDEMIDITGSGPRMKRRDYIVTLIRNGAFDYIAAEASGIDDSTFWRWMERGRQGRKPYKDFCDKVTAAKALARATAEMAVNKNTPQVWLMKGPGRQTLQKMGRPGWSDKVEIEIEEKEPLPFERLSEEQQAQLAIIMGVLQGPPDEPLEIEGHEVTNGDGAEGEGDGTTD